MPLLSLWGSNPDAVGQLNIEQIVATAGDGNLRDASTCSEELRGYLADVPSDQLGVYVEHCLASSFNRAGMVLQDLINEVGRRLDYDVTNGRYQGIPSAIGFDGLWRSPEGNDLIVEVKTTDAYRLSLDTLASYRRRLLASDGLGENSSILIVVGRQDTGELEAQIRGSRHAWDIRLISAEALLKLLKVKENSEEAETGTKIRSLFTPVEYTRLDRMVDIVFTAATDTEVVETPQGEVNAVSAEPKHSSGKPDKGTYQFTDSAILHAKRLTIIEALSAREQTHLLQKSRAQYWNAARDVRAVCSISKRYQNKTQLPYWYAYHPQWDEFLNGADRSYFVLGGMDIDRAFAIPVEAIRDVLPDLNQTIRESGAYWHIHLIEQDGHQGITRSNGKPPFSIEQFSFVLKA